MYRIMLALHIIAGSVALLSMIAPMVAAKGGQAHRRAGWVFTIAMTVVSVSAITMSAWLIIDNDYIKGLRLLGLALITASAVSAGIRALHLKQSASIADRRWDIALAAVLVLTAIPLFWVGAREHQGLFFYIGSYCVILGSQNIHYWLRPPSTPRHWWLKHMRSMLSACLFATAAFLSNLPLSGVSQPVTNVVLTSLVAGAVGIFAWTHYYRRKFAAAAIAAVAKETP